MGKLVIFSAPSGSGKTTIVKELLPGFPELEFSISATSRAPRGREVQGVDYYFYSAEEFRAKIKNDEFLEWEEVYEGTYYGTLKSEVDRIWKKGHSVIFDIDVEGGVNLKSQFGNKALSLFVKAPSLEELELRLRGRNTDSEEKIIQRMDKASRELTYAPKFDVTIVNDELTHAVNHARTALKAFFEND
mgnify:CR=1 FL=1